MFNDNYFGFGWRQRNLTPIKQEKKTMIGMFASILQGTMVNVPSIPVIVVPIHSPAKLKLLQT